MSKLKINHRNTSCGGTSLVGYINIPHSKLVEILGEGLGSGDKTLEEWVLEGEVNGKKVVATIYDWKNYGRNVETIMNWHIGGHDNDAIKLVESIFPNHRTKIAF